ncbi:NAD(P)/FAD-dependent oxidoreductase, partial [Halobium palmae]
AAGHVNPTTGGGIPGAAKSAHWAVKRAVEAISEGDTSESALWSYNRDVMTDFGKKFAGIDLYNVWGTAHDVEELTDVVTAVPGQQLADALGRGTGSSMGLGLKLKTAVETFGHRETLGELYRVQRKAAELRDHYDRYPASPEAFEAWKEVRDGIMDDVYAITGADPKY